jgi:anti-sigma-K factor RskA
MKYERPELLERLAADYVLGLLRHRARARFERLCAELPPALRARQAWEDLLLPLCVGASLAPGAELWPQIRDAIEALNADSVVAFPAKPSRGTRRWRWVALAASLVALAFLLGRFTVWNAPAWQPVAVLAPANAAPLWRLERSADASKIHLRAVAPITLNAANSYELWILPSGKGSPVSLGLLPRRGDVERVLTPAQRALLLAASQVAVSLEPPGGSPTGLPTGPVIIVAAITRTT